MAQASNVLGVQVIITGCWLTAKEVALVGGTLVHCVPLLDFKGTSSTPAGGPSECWLLLFATNEMLRKGVEETLLLE